MQGVTDQDVTFKEIMVAATPYMLFDVLVIAMIIIWPSLALWLPNIIGT
jgi:TRAP-type mannitol/chloroaromatic compound transport system permease large subunit